jgi:deoxyribodipyrimidine photo-lyase
MMRPMARATIVWLRQDLRLSDNEALDAAVLRGGPVLPLFAWAPDEEGEWPPGAATRWWLHHSLTELDASLRERGSRLIVRRGPSLDAIVALARESGADAVHWSRRHEPASVARDERVEAALRAEGIEVQDFGSALLLEPEEIRTKQGGPYQVFTPFWRALSSGARLPDPVAAPRAIPVPQKWPRDVSIESLGLMPTVRWDAGLAREWTPGEAGGQSLLKTFIGEGADDYDGERNTPSHRGTSRLSPHLHFGEVSVRQAWAARVEALRKRGLDGSPDPWLRQLAWRDFAHHLMHHFPHTTTEPLRPEFARFPWRSDAASLAAWQCGLTGYPIVDAGMRELWETGWMHNRVRMIVASFLVKHLLVPWQEGARWFWDTLVDADLANNSFGWQWTAGCGADAAPYFRIFNPVTQGETYDAEGAYVRRFVPELARVPAKFIHAPWTAPPLVLLEAGVTLGRDYPQPIVDHAMARARALEASKATRLSSSVATARSRRA